MSKSVSIDFYLDTRRQKKNRKYPVKLYICANFLEQKKLYSTKFDFTEKEFKSIWLTVKPRTEHKDKRKQLEALKTKANEVADKIPDFNFDDFERLMYNKSRDKSLTVNFYFEKAIQERQAKGQIGTAKLYLNALDCLLRFKYPNQTIPKDFREKPQLKFKDVTVSFLEQFETFCLETENKSQTTVGIYLRHFRAILNTAKGQKVLSPDRYPFGRGKYQIKAPKRTNKALNKEQIKILFDGKPQTPQQQKAKDFWFFSYLCNGFNPKDIFSLKYKNIKKDTLVFRRQKNKRTTQNQKEVKIFLHPFALEVIRKYGNPDKQDKNFVFDVFNAGMTAKEKHREKNNFIRFINQHFRKYAKSLGIDDKVSCVIARHSFSTILLRSGKPIELISKALAHTNTKTTENYLHGFADETLKDIQNDLL